MHWLSACRPSPVSLGWGLYALGARYLAVWHRSIRPRKFLSRKGKRRCHARDLGGQAQATDLIVITQEAMSTVRGCRQGEAQQIIR